MASSNYAEAKAKLHGHSRSLEDYPDGHGNSVKVTSNDLSWRLVYDDERILGVFDSTGYTRSINTVELFPNWTAANARANALHLIYEPEG